MTDFDFAPPSPGRLRPQPARGRQAAALQHGAGHRVPPTGSRCSRVGAAGGSTISTTILQIIVNHVDFGMSLPAGARRARGSSQTNSATSLAEPDFYNSALAQQLTSSSVSSSRCPPGRSCRWTTTLATRPGCSSWAAAWTRRSPSRSGCTAAAPWSCTPQADSPANSSAAIHAWSPATFQPCQLPGGAAASRSPARCSGTTPRWAVPGRRRRLRPSPGPGSPPIWCRSRRAARSTPGSEPSPVPDDPVQVDLDRQAARVGRAPANPRRPPLNVMVVLVTE